MPLLIRVCALFQLMYVEEHDGRLVQELFHMEVELRYYIGRLKRYYYMLYQIHIRNLTTRTWHVQSTDK
jgi:hypothetical protein